MQSVILVGGLGKRLHPITHEIPKPMVLVNRKPFLEYLVFLLRTNGLTNILLLTGYLGKVIENYFGDGSKFGVSISYSREQSPLGTGGALKNAKCKLKEEFLLLNGDTFLQLDFAKFISFFNKQDGIGITAVYNNVENIAPNNILLDNSNLILSYDKQNPERMSHVDAGVSILKKRFLELIPEKKTFSLEEEAFPMLIRKKELMGFPIKERFYDIGTFGRLRMFREFLK